jgi:DNA-binding NarL/FixJ family response regulator
MRLPAGHPGGMVSDRDDVSGTLRPEARRVPARIGAESPARIVIALAHTRLRDALARALQAPGTVTIVGRESSLEGAIRATRASRPDSLVLGTGLLRGDAVGDLNVVVTALPGVRVIVVGHETSEAYGFVMRAAGAADYIALDRGAEVLAQALLDPLPEAATRTAV